jgi:hypothetical protein
MQMRWLFFVCHFLFLMICSFSEAIYLGRECCCSFLSFQPADTFTLRVEEAYGFGKFIEIPSRHYEEVGLFITSPTFCNVLMFGDFRGYQIERGKWSQNYGIGFRGWNSCLNAVVGVNGYYGYTRFSRKGFSFAGIGFELLGSCFDIRLNGYLPTGHHNREHSRFFFFEGGFFGICTEHENAMKGFDGELGWKVGRILCAPCSQISVYAAVGGYYYENKKLPNTISGSKARIELEWDRFLKAEAGVYYDKADNRARFEGKITLSVPLELCREYCSFSSCCFDILRQPVRRNGLNFVHRRCCWFWNW